MQKTTHLKQLEQAVHNCTNSPLYTYRQENGYLPVIGEGSPDATIMFIGEAPGKNEARTGKPFCGAAGKILNELLEAAHLARSKVYITNIVKDRPPENRDPTPGEIDIYTPFLDQQIEIIQPKVLATLGRFSMTYILQKFDCKEKNDPISKNHGVMITAQTSYGSISILPLYHPAVALYNRSKKNILIQDIQQLRMI